MNCNEFHSLHGYFMNVLNHPADRVRLNHMNCHYQLMHSHEGISHFQVSQIFEWPL
jgi:hypothetical protein